MLTSTSITRKELYQLIWTEPMTKVAPRFGLSDVGLAKVCKRYNIPRPPVGYWAQKQVGKQPSQTPLPPAPEHHQVIEFLVEEKTKSSDHSPKRSDRVRDEQLKAMIAFEEQPENRVVVPVQVSRYHPFVRQTKKAFTDRFAARGLCYPSWSAEEARLSIKVAKESIPRALLLMDTLLKAFEDRGHKVVFEPTEHRKEVCFDIQGEKFSLQLREKTKMIRLSEAERKKSYLYNLVRYEAAGLFELQLHGCSSHCLLATWKDGVRTKLEHQLNEVLIAMIVGVERERDWRKHQEEYERQRREAERKRWQQQEERRKEQQKIQELEQMMDFSDKAMRIREFMQEVCSHVEQTNGPIAEGSELACWIAWALDYADRIDPLGRKSQPHAAQDSVVEAAPSRKPR